MSKDKDPNDKYSKYDFGLHCKEEHAEDEWDSEHDGKIADWHQSDRDWETIGCFPTEFI